MKDDIHNTVQVDSNTDKAVLVNLGEVEKTLLGKKGTKVSSHSYYLLGGLAHGLHPRSFEPQ